MGGALRRGEVAEEGSQAPAARPDGGGGGVGSGAGAGDDDAPVASMAELMGLAPRQGGGPSASDVLRDFRAHIEAALHRLLLCAAEQWNPAGNNGGLAVEAQLLETSENAAMSTAFADGAALQCLQVMCGPPGPLLCKWRYVGTFIGEYCDSAGSAVKGQGQIVDIEGVCQAMVTPDKTQVASTELFYNVPGLIKAMVDHGAESAGDGACPVTGKSGFCPVLGISA
mmetsp:Transcript_43443/g.139626  ORF Transcript_43443/g.139626 Transcript_43443/m.139626 type:complete len:226 (-) Transcript_43443:176-853(-)